MLRFSIAAGMLILITATGLSAQLPTHIQLFGPVQGNAGLTQKLGPDWKFPGSAFSASTKTFEFQLGYTPVSWARWVFIWTPKNTASSARLVHMDESAANLTEICQIPPNAAQAPIVTGCNITTVFNALIVGAQKKHIGFQTKDNGIDAWSLYESRLEISWNLP